MKIAINKFLLLTVGRWFPLRRHPGGKIGNLLRCHFTKRIIASMGKKCIVEKGAEILEGCVFGDRTAIGPNCLVSAGTVFKGHNMMGPNVHIYTVNHKYDKTTHSFNGMTDIEPVVIGEYVWIGYGVTILPGVTVGDHTIIGAGSVVTKDIPSGVVAAGNPCRVKKVLDEDFYEGESL
ncbi:MAG: acyltransferase [Clostridia bacterium]|nr:acyltransferase [Clostridia bacterium]